MPAYHSLSRPAHPASRFLRQTAFSFVRTGSALALFGVLLTACAHPGAASAATPPLQAAARLNNEGVAFMNQQFTEKALAKFQEAYRADASSAIPLVNQGIALVYLNNLPDAKEKLTQATQADPRNVRAWYSLGVADFSSGAEDAALVSFEHAETLDPKDPDIHYFLGAILSSGKKFDRATTEFQTAIELYPLHASAQFGLARVLQREGKPDEAREHVKRFREITDTKIGTLIGTSYGDQGRYATAQDILTVPPHAAEMIPVKFVTTQGPAASLTAAASGGACIVDLEGNGTKDLVTMAPGEGLRAFRPAPGGTLTPIAAAQTGLTVHGDGVACAVGDYDNDGLPDLALALSDRVVLFHNLGHGKFADVTASVGIKPGNHPAALTFVDYDHDGDLDLLVTGDPTPAHSTPNLLWRNNGNSTFTEWSEPAGLAGTAPTRAAVLSDLNNDRAVDLVIAPASGSPVLYLNQREGPFKQLPLYTDATLPPVRAIAVSDLDKDGWMDLVLTHDGAPGITLWRNLGGHGFERMPLTLPGVKSAWGVTTVDVDNDSWIDLAVVVETAKGNTELRVLRNLGSGNFADVSAQLGLTGLPLKHARGVLAADIDHDGAPDLIASQQNAPPMLLRNVGGNRNHSLRIDLTGLADNKSGIGTKIEVFSDGNWQKFEVSGASGYLGQGPTEILAGLGQSTDASVVRLLWPTGVPQDELSLAANKPLTLTELDRRGSSCPVLFAWDGTKYQFITDVIGAAVVGHWISPTAYNQSDTDEWVKIDGNLLQARDGNFSVRFGEPMEEINYVDQLRLVAVDHPANTNVFPDERFLSEQPFASGQTVVASPQTRPLAGAWDDSGHDVLATLTSQTAGPHHYVRNFTNLTYAGFANPHSLTLDLGDWSPRNPLRLFAHGYVEYFSASSMYAAWQAGIVPHPPTIQAQLPDGSWKTVIEDAGFPAGLPRTVVYDLTGKLPPHTRRIRLQTNLQIYWDGILVDNGPDAVQSVHQTELPLTAAHLAFRGYPKQIERETPGDLTYDYQSISQTGPFGWQRGNYTHYGDVTPLLNTRDDHYVIFGSGEDIDAEFSDATLPALPTGWKRDYFFYADGFVKDMDFYEALPFTVTELPFHNMSAYPYPTREHFPDDPATLNYELNWNDRTESGNRTQLFQFHYAPSSSVPIGPDTPHQLTGGTR